MPILNGQKEGKHIMKGWQGKNQQCSASELAGEPLWGRWGEVSGGEGETEAGSKRCQRVLLSLSLCSSGEKHHRHAYLA